MHQRNGFSQDVDIIWYSSCFSSPFQPVEIQDRHGYQFSFTVTIILLLAPGQSCGHDADNIHWDTLAAAKELTWATFSWENEVLNV